LAGRKQHYLPQHLLRGFEASKAGKKTQVVVYRKGISPYTTSTEGVAAERDFYSPPGDGVTDTLDDVITAFETSSFNPFLDRARTAPADVLLDAESAASAVVHLTLRAAHLRGSFAHLARKMLTKFGDVLNDPELIREFVDVDSTHPESILSEEIRKMFDALPVAAFPTKERLIFEKMARFRAREKFDAQMPESTTALREQFSMFEKALPEIVVRGHTKALEKSLVPAERVNALKRLLWRVFPVESPDHFVLPDCAAVASGPSGRLEPVAMSSNEEIAWIAMPISAKQVLVGYAGQEPPMLSDLNKHFATCSLEFFVSSAIQSDVDELAAHIGEALEAMTYDLVEDSFAKARPEREQPPIQSDAAKIRDVPVDIQSAADKRTAIGEAIQEIFTQQCGAREADRLESIVVTNDVAQEVGRLYGRSLSPYETAATMPGTVELVPGTAPVALRLILPEPIGSLLLSADVRLKRSATSLLKQLLGRVSYLDHWHRHVVPLAEGRVFTRRQLIALELTSRFAAHYHGSVKASPAVHDTDLHEAEPLSAHAVAVSVATLEAARHQFKSHKNVDALLADAVLALDMLLGTLASYCGQRPHASASRQLSHATPTCEHVVRAGLWEWLALFGRDLHRHYQSVISESSSVDEVRALSEHVERVLWQFGIFLSDLDDGRAWIDVSDDEQLERVRQILRS
jgi:hypothetical protein